MDFTLTFLSLFFRGMGWLAPILLFLGLLILCLGLLVGRFESWNRFDAAYWACITALTVGYGDIRPARRRSRLLAVVIAGLGIMFTGIVVAITVESASAAFRLHAGGRAEAAVSTAMRWCPGAEQSRTRRSTALVRSERGVI